MKSINHYLLLCRFYSAEHLSSSQALASVIYFPKTKKKVQVYVVFRFLGYDASWEERSPTQIGNSRYWAMTSLFLWKKERISKIWHYRRSCSQLWHNGGFDLALLLPLWGNKGFCSTVFGRLYLLTTGILVLIVSIQLHSRQKSHF